MGLLRHNNEIGYDVVNRIIMNQAALDARSTQIINIGYSLAIIFTRSETTPLRPTGGEIIGGRLYPTGE